MTNKLENPRCCKCGAEMSLRYVKSSGMDITPVGMFADCARCGYSERTKSLDEKGDYNLTN